MSSTLRGKREVSPFVLAAEELRRIAANLEAADGVYPLRSGTTDDKVWNLRINRYHRDNLLALFNAIGYPWGSKQADPALAPWNTGDWVGEIPMMLARTDGSMIIDEKDHPNQQPRVVTETVRDLTDRLAKALGRIIELEKANGS